MVHLVLKVAEAGLDCSETHRFQRWEMFGGFESQRAGFRDISGSGIEGCRASERTARFQTGDFQILLCGP